MNLKEMQEGYIGGYGREEKEGGNYNLKKEKINKMNNNKT